MFLENAEESEVDGFLENLINKTTKNSLKSIIFCKYFAMTMYMCVSDYLRKLSLNPYTILESDARTQVEMVDENTVLPYVASMFRAVISNRKNEFGKQSKSQLSEAIKYVDEHYQDSNLCLNQVAKEINISPSYLSAMFSKENKTTFVEYMTTKRMEHAKKMLLTTGEKSQTIAEQVGYKDPHYFSYIFKKTYGLSPKEFRTKERGA